MIIEAGYDLAMLLFDRPLELGTLRIVTLDTELRVAGSRTVTDRFTGELDASVFSAIADAIPEPHEEGVLARFNIGYAALGYRLPSIERYPEGFDWDRVSALKDWLACFGIELLGLFVDDGESFASTGPVHAFESDIGTEDLPRVLIVPGPHPFLTCECLVCGPKREALERARQRHHDDDVSESV